MKRFLSAALALSLLGGSAAVAAPYDHGGQRGYGNQGYSSGYSDRGRHNDDGTAIVAGVGILALAAILASQHRHHDGWYGRDGGRGYDNDRNRGYGSNDHGGSYGDNDRHR
jgi:hypothetical protein